MLEFKKIEIDDIDIYNKFMKENCELSCETSFVNLLVWQCTYNNMMAVCDNLMIIKSGSGKRTSFRLPYGDDFDRGMELIKEHCNGKYPDFWIQDGPRFDSFKQHYGSVFKLEEKRDAFDYIYLRDNLAELSGKKYHSKRNHISAFSKKYDWEYKAIDKTNVDEVKECAQKWYTQNSERLDNLMLCEMNGVNTILDNMERLRVKGGAIYVDGKVIAFTLGSPINNEIFDIHIEKALNEYATAYTLINREFAKNELANYKFINREDDLGLEGLRKAKLSYKPEILLKKYHCRTEG